MASFRLAVEFVLGNEGGFQRRPEDSGNYYRGELLGTNHGITAATARSWGYTGPMEDLPRETAIKIYRDLYWQFDGIQDQRVASKILDLVVNMGESGGTLVAQRAANRLVDPPTAEDGRYGPDTEATVNAAPPADLLAALSEEAAAHYEAIAEAHPEKAIFLDGWLTRALKSPAAVGMGAGLLLLLGIGAYALARGMRA